MHETAPIPKPKILIAVPGYNGIVPEAMHSFLSMIFRCGRDLPDYDVAVEIVTKREQFRARNHLIDAAIGSGCTWLLMLDDDMIVPPDLVGRLLAHDKDICGALYYQRGGSYHPVILQRHVAEDGTFRTSFLRPTDPVITQPGLHPVDIIGGGCMLFRVDVFRKLMPPYFEFEKVLGTDVNICSRFLDAGVQIFCDTTLELGHVASDRPIITSRSVPLANRELADIGAHLWDDAVAYLCMHPQELESAMIQDSQRAQRQAKWHARDRSTWEGAKAFYQEYGDWHVRNLLYYNLSAPEPTKEWAFFRSEALLGSRANVIDLGCGLGHVALPLAERLGARVHAYEIAGAATLPFLRYRLRTHGLGIQADRHRGVILYEMEQPVPDASIAPPVPIDGAFAISMIEHTWDPWGTLRWLAAQVKPGGFLVCDYAVQQMDEEPQHLCRYDPATFATHMAEIGWHESPEYRWLFLKRP